MVTTPTVWLAQHQVNLTGLGDQSDPAIVDIGEGRYIVVWTEATGGPIATSPGTDLVGQIFSANGNPFGTEFRVNDALFQLNEQDAALASRPGGGFVMTYERTGVSGTSICVQTYNVDGNTVAGTPFTIEADSNDDVLSNPSVAIRSNGSYLVAYNRLRDSDDTTDIVGKIVSTDGDVGDEFSILNSNDTTRNADTDVLSNGRYVVVYEDADDDTEADFDPQFSILDSTGETIHSGTIASGARMQTDVQVAALSGGGFVAAWTEVFPGSGEGIVARIYDNAGVAQGGTFVVNSSTDGNQNEPDIAALNDGGFVVTWDNDELDHVRGQRFDADGDEVGNEFVAGSQGSEFNPVVAGLSDGRFAVGFWQTTGDDDIWARIFDPRTSPIEGTSVRDVLTSRVEGATVKGLDGNDDLFGVQGADNLRGGDRHDRLSGLDGADTLYGQDGNDKLNGGAGKDLLNGGDGADAFVFNAALNAVTNVDRIIDFNVADDTIRLSGDVFSGLGANGVLTANRFHIGAAAHDANDRIIYKSTTGALFHDSNGDAAGGVTKFAVLDPGLALTNADFLVI